MLNKLLHRVCKDFSVSVISSEAIHSSGLGTPGQTLSTKFSHVCTGEQSTSFLKSKQVFLSVQINYFLLVFFPLEWQQACFFHDI